MKNQRRRGAKLKRELARRAVQLRPEGGPNATNGRSASSLRSRQRDLAFLQRNGAPCPEWY